MTMLRKEKEMSAYNKMQLESMLEDVVNELDLSDIAIEKHGQLGTAPAKLVRIVLKEKDMKIHMLERKFKSIKAVS